MKSTTRFNKNKHGIECLNCEQPLSDKDNFCSNCGQVNDTLPLSIKQFISEFFAGFFSFDTRFFKTFMPLLFKPGKVSKEYIEGKRRRYVSPFQLYLHVTIVFFLLQGLFYTIDEYRIVGISSKNKAEIAIDSTNINDSIFKKNNLIKDSSLLALPLFKGNDSIAISNHEGTKKDSSTTNSIKQKLLFRIDSVFASTDILEKLKNDSISKDEKDSIYKNFYKSNIKFISKQVKNEVKNDDWNDVQEISNLSQDATNHIQQIFKFKEINYTIPENFKLPLDANLIGQIVRQKSFKIISEFLTYNKENTAATAIDAMEDLGLEKTSWNAFHYRVAQNINRAKDDKDFLKSFVQSIISKTSVALFFLLPIFTLFLSLIYIRRKWNYTEHLVFVFNVQTVFFLLLIFFTVFDRILKTDLGILLFLPVFLFYLMRALRNFYGQPWLKTFIKFILLNVIYITLGLFGTIIIAFIAFVF